MYRYNLLEKWQWAHCTGTTQTCTGTHVQKIDSGEIVRTSLTCTGTTVWELQDWARNSIKREDTLVNEPNWENHIGGEYKSKRAQVKGSFDF